MPFKLFYKECSLLKKKTYNYYSLVSFNFFLIGIIALFFQNAVIKIFQRQVFKAHTSI